MNSQEWIERRDSHKQHKPRFKWIEFRRSYRQLAHYNASVSQFVMTYLFWKANFEQAQQGQPATSTIE